MKRRCCPTIPYKKVTHVIFDLDGTILDTETLIEEVLIEICKKHEKRFPPAMHNRTAGTTATDIAKLLISELKLSLTEYEFVDLYNELTREKCSDIKFMPGAEGLIRHFHHCNVPIAIATSSTEELMKLKTRFHSEIFDMFHHIVSGGSDPEVVAGKPAPDIFRVCASRFDDNPSPSQCLVLEDAPNGVLGAQRAGMQTVIIPRDDVPHEIWKTATLRLDSLEYIAPELFGLPPLINQSYPIPKVSFTMHYDEKSGKDDAQAEQKEGEKEKKTFGGNDALPDAEPMFTKNEYI